MIVVGGRVYMMSMDMSLSALFFLAMLSPCYVISRYYTFAFGVAVPQIAMQCTQVSQKLSARE